MLVNGPIGGCGVGEFLSAPVMFQRGNENLKTPPQAPALMVEMSHCYKTLRAKKDCAEQTTIKQLLSHAGDNHQGSNMSQHAKTRRGVLWGNTPPECACCNAPRGRTHRAQVRSKQ